MRFHVQIQVNNGDPCPKHERYAWDFEDESFETLTECIEWILEKQPAGFTIFDNTDEEFIAVKNVSHY